MAASISNVVDRITIATPAAIATALGGVITAQDVTELRKLLAVMALRPGESVPLMSLAGCGLLPS